MALFETYSIKKEDDDDHLFPLDEEQDMVICKNPGKLNTLLNSISNAKAVVYVSDGDWSMHDLTMELLKRYRPAELYITTYALRELSVRQIILAQDRGEITRTNMLLDYRAKVRVPEVYQLASNNMNRIHLTSIHAKVTVIKTELACISIIGSANWTTNPRVECGMLSMNKDLAEFNISWINKIMDNAEIFG